MLGAHDDESTFATFEFVESFLYLPRVRTRKDLTAHGGAQHSSPDETRVRRFVTSSSPAHEVNFVVRGFTQDQSRVVNFGRRVEVSETREGVTFEERRVRPRS